MEIVTDIITQNSERRHIIGQHKKKPKTRALTDFLNAFKKKIQSISFHLILSILNNKKKTIATFQTSNMKIIKKEAKMQNRCPYTHIHDVTFFSLHTLQ